MRTAVCLSGFPRTMEFSFAYFKKYILDELNPDIFFFGYSDDRNDISSQKILDYYNPVSYFIREYTDQVQHEIWIDYGTPEIKNVRLVAGTPIQILSQYYNLFHSNRLKTLYERQNNFTYDLVIRARTDYYFYRGLTDLELETQPNTVYIPDIWDFEGVSSGFAYGQSTAMDTYSNLFNKIREYNLEHKFVFHPESLKGYHIKQSGLERQVVKNHYWWDLSDFEVNDCANKYVDGLDRCPSRRLYT